MRKLILLLSLFLICSTVPSCIRPATTATGIFQIAGSHLKIASNQRHLAHAHDNQQFFVLADTAWEMMSKLSPAEIDRYFADRSTRGFTGVMLAVITPFTGADRYPAIGVAPFDETDGAQLNETFAQRLDYIIQQAARYDMVVFLAPNFGWHQDLLTPITAHTYGSWLATRYKAKNNIVWMMGGDIRPEQVNAEIWKEMAAGIRAADPRALITFHPFGPNSSASSNFFGIDTNNDWLDFNMSQPSHGTALPKQGWELIREDLTKFSQKPTIIGEISYENIISFFGEGRVTPEIIRRDAYWSYLSGALGHTYGHNEIQQMWRGSDQGDHIPPQFGAGGTFSWDDALAAAGASQLTYLANLFTSRSWEKLVPHQEKPFLTIAQGEGVSYKGAAIADDGSWAMIYLPTGGSVSVDMSQFSASVFLKVYNPVTGAKLEQQGPFPNSGTKTLQSTAVGGPDLVFILESDTLISQPPS